VQPGDRVSCAGYVTQLHYVAGRPAEYLEDLVGYRSGRLEDGWALLHLLQMPASGDFEFRGYSHMSGGVYGGHKADTRDRRTAQEHLADAGHDVERLKAGVIAGTFRIDGRTRLVKIIPNRPPFGSDDYPLGLGVPQWELLRPLPFVVAQIILPEGVPSWR
jgi:hypothetical protein